MSTFLRFMRQAGLALAVMILCAPVFSATSKKSMKVTVIHASRFDVSPPLRDIPPAPPSVEGEEAEPPQRLPLNAPPRTGRDPLLQMSAPSAPSQQIASPNVNFPGLGQGFTGFSVNFAPPDTNMAVGPNHILQIVNASFAVFSKTGTTILTPRTIQTVWAGFGGGCETNNNGDPVAQYDQQADRWIISQFSVGPRPFTPPFLECVAVSTSGDPTGTYNRYAFSYGSNFPDYPKIGVWPDAYYISYNLFTAGGSFLGAQACALDRTTMLSGGAATQQCFQTGTSAGGLLPSDLDGATPPPAGSPNYFASLSFSGTSVSIWKFHVDWATPANTTFTGPTDIPVAAYSPACGGGTCIPQTGTTQQLDSLADRLMYRLAYRNFGDHESLLVNHSVAPNGTSGSGVRWYEIRISSGTPSLFQQGTYAPDTSFRWMGSIAMDKSGNAGLGFSLSDASSNPAIHYTGRLAADPAGQMPQGEGTIINGTGSQLTTLSRWGDYSAMRIDPSDDCTFWYTTEYIPTNGTFNWRTQIASFQLQACQLHLSVSAPASATAGTPFSVTVTAQDASNATATGYTGTVHFTASGSSSVPADYTFVPGDNGVHTFTNGFTLNTAGSQTVFVSDAANHLNGSSNTITVGSAGADHYSLTFPPSATVGTPFNMRVVVQDAFNNTVQGYTGTVHFTSSGAPATLPADYTYSGSGGGNDNGQHTFSFTATGGAGTTLTLTARDTVNATVTATTAPAINVTSDAFITPQGRNIHLFRPNTSLVIASFTDADVSETGSNYTVSINWGDGTTPDSGCTLVSTQCKIVRVGSTSTFNVLGTHSYRRKGSYVVHVSLTDSGGSLADAFSTARFFPINSSH